MIENERAAALTAINEMERWVERKYGRFNEFVKLTEAARAALTPLAPLEPPIEPFDHAHPDSWKYEAQGHPAGLAPAPSGIASPSMLGMKLPPLPLPEPVKPVPMYCGCGEEFQQPSAYGAYREWRCSKCGGNGPFSTKLQTFAYPGATTYTAEQMRAYGLAALALHAQLEGQPAQDGTISSGPNEQSESASSAGLASDAQDASSVGPLLRMVFEDMEICWGERGSEYAFQDLSTETVDAIVAHFGGVRPRVE